MSEKHLKNHELNGNENGSNNKINGSNDISSNCSSGSNMSQNGCGKGIIRRSKALYVSSTMPLKSQVQNNGSSITANKTVTGIYNYGANNTNNWNELSLNAKNNFMSLDRHMNLPNYSQVMSPPSTPPYKAQSLGPNSAMQYSNDSLDRNSVYSLPPANSMTIPQANANITNSSLSPNILPSTNILSSSPPPSYILINGNTNMEVSSIHSPTSTYNVIEDSNGRKLSTPSLQGSIQINGNYNIVEDNHGRRLSNSSQQNAIQVSNGNLFLQNAYSSSSNTIIYGSPTSSPPSSPKQQNIMYSLPRNLNSSQGILLSQSPTNQGPGVVQRFKNSQVPISQRYSLPILSNSYTMMNPNYVSKSNTTIDYSNNSPMHHHPSQYNVLSLKESNTIGNFSGLNINGQEYYVKPKSTSSSLMNSNSKGSNHSCANTNSMISRNGSKKSSRSANSNSIPAKIPVRKDSSCLVDSFNSNYSLNANSLPKSLSLFTSPTNSQGSNDLPTNIPSDNVNASISPVAVSQPIDIPLSSRSSSSDTDSSFSSYRSSNYVMSITQGNQMESTYAEVHQCPPPYEHSFMDQDSIDLNNNDHDLIFDLEHTTSIPRSNSDEKELIEGMPNLFNKNRYSKEYSAFDHVSFNNDALSSPTAFSNFLDSYSRIFDYYGVDGEGKEHKEQHDEKENQLILESSVSEAENIQKKRESNEVKRNSSTLLGVDINVEKEILKKRSTLRSKDRIIADEILRKMSISHANSVKKESLTHKQNSIIKEKTTNTNDTNADSEVIGEACSHDNDDASVPSGERPGNNLEENVKSPESEDCQNIISENESTVTEPAQIIENCQEDISGKSVLGKSSITDIHLLDNEKDTIDIGLDIFNDFYEKCLEKINVEESDTSEKSDQSSSLIKNKESMENIPSIDRNNSIIDFDDEIKGNFLSGFLYSNVHTTPSLENIKKFLQSDSLSDKEKNNGENEIKVVANQHNSNLQEQEMISMVQDKEVVVVETKEKQLQKEKKSSFPSEPEQDQISKEKTNHDDAKVITKTSLTETEANKDSISSEQPTESSPTEVTEVSVTGKEACLPKEATHSSHPLPSIPIAQKKEIDGQAESFVKKEGDKKEIDSTTVNEFNTEAKKESSEPDGNPSDENKPKDVSLSENESNSRDEDTSENESKSKDEVTSDKEIKPENEKLQETSEREKSSKEDSISSNDSMKRIEVILKKNSDRGNRIILPQSISDINKENKDEKPFIPNNTEVKQLIDRGLSNSSDHNIDNTQFFWSSDVQANTEVHPSEICNHTNSLPEKLLGTIPSRKKSFAESAYVITRDSISNDINGKPVIDPKNYIRYRRSRVIWEHYNNSYLKHRMMSWSSTAIIRSKTIGSCYIKPQHSTSISSSNKKNMPIRSHTTEVKSNLVGKGPVTNYYEFLTPSIEALKEDNEMLTKVVNDMIKSKESEKNDKQDSTMKEEKGKKTSMISNTEDKEEEKTKYPSKEGKLQTKKVQINEDNNQVVSTTTTEEIIQQYMPNDSSISYSKTIYENTTEEDLERIVEENSRAKRSGWAIWWSIYACQEDTNNRLMEQKQINENDNKNLLRKIRRFGNKSKKSKKQKKKRNRNSNNKNKDSAVVVPVVTNSPPPKKSERKESLSIPRRQSSLSNRRPKAQKKEDIPYTQTLKPSPLLSPQLIPVDKMNKKPRSKLNRGSIIKNKENEEDYGYSSDSSFSSLSSVSTISSLSSLNEHLQLSNQQDLLPVSSNNSNVKEIFQDQFSELSDIASYQGSPLFSSADKDISNSQEFDAMEDVSSPSISSSLPDDFVLPTVSEPQEIFNENNILDSEERELLVSSSFQFEELPNNVTPIYDLAEIISTPSELASAQPIFVESSSSPSQKVSNFELENEKFNAISNELCKQMESIYKLQLSLQQQFEQISLQLQERQSANKTILQEEIDAIKQENEWRQNCVQQQKLIKQKQLELQDKQRKLQMEQELLQQRQIQQQEIYRQEQQLQMQEIQLSQLKIQLQLQEQIKEQLQRQQQLQPMETSISSSSYYNAMPSPKPAYEALNDKPTSNNLFDKEISEMFKQSSYNPFNDYQTMEEEQAISDISKERMDIKDLIQDNYSSDESVINSDYYSDFTSNSDFTDYIYDSTTGSEYSIHHTFNDRLHIYKPEDDLPYARFNPLVEKALYQLSWNKLTKNRRSLHQQVIIRNLMIYYFTLNMENSHHSRKSSMRRKVPHIKGVGKKRSRTK
ncbi:hypothetical protein BCR36DRAFT_414106 [Piromyces finnis]|uniref:Protein Zds1 C-terminal domain-containing protein n=1 Tax=Piromyces finnis TaxID=1754191 RepID=A0A1Y1V4Y2_9FUNG|nr:hypothetical protein BCR36DRAFT_414106 [Piromyces finnis]|eukprot:ORX46443.1 hypothetical protein BCR36DRAFT_414106 [Piromyces finnis]